MMNSNSLNTQTSRLPGNRILFKNWSLRTKLVSAFLVVTLIPLAIVSYLNYRSTTQALLDAANVKIAGAAQVTADELDSFFINTLNSTRVKAQDPAILDYLLLPSFQRNGSPQEAQLYKLLTSYSREDPLYVNSIGVIDARGNSLVDTSQDEIGVKKSDRIYFQQAMSTGVPYSSDVIFSEVSGKPSLYFTAPVYNTTDGKILGVFRIRYDAGILQSIVAKNNGLAGADSVPVLLDDDHIRLAHGAVPALDYKSVVPFSEEVLASLQADHHLPAGTAEELSTNLPEYETGLNSLDTQPFFVADLSVDEQRTVKSTTTAVRLETHPWLIAFGQSQDVFLAPIQSQTRNSLVLAVVLALAVVGFGLFMAASLTGPVVRLTAVANQIAAGDIHVQAKAETADEIGALARTFNTMTAQLRDFITSLEQRVQDRTKALSSVAEVSTAASTILETDKLLQKVVDLSKERFDFYHAHIYLLNEAGDTLVLASGAGEPGRQMVAEGRSISLDREQSLVARAARERKGVTVNDVATEPDFLPNPLLPDTHSELAVPMIVGEQVIGVFDVQSEVAGRFTDADIAVQTTLASQVASAVQNARLYTQAETALEEARSLVDYAAEGIAVLDLTTGLFTESNENAQKIYGLSREELSEVGPAKMSPPRQPDGRDSTEKALEQIGIAMEKGVNSFEWNHINAQGQEFPCDIRLVRMPGARPRIRLSILDISERKHLQELTAQRARQQEAINLITQKIQSATTIESALQVTARELGRALGMKPTLVTIEPGHSNGKRTSDS